VSDMSDGGGMPPRGVKSKGCRLLLMMALLALALPGAVRAYVGADDEADRWLHEEITGRLLGQVALHPRDLNVVVHDGHVQVTGSVAALEEVDAIDRIVHGVVGVRTVDNRLTVRPSTRSDLAITQEVRTLLDKFPALRWPAVDVSVKEGRVTLSGQASEAMGRAEAERQARKVAGVTGVENQIHPLGSPAPLANPDELQVRVRSLLANPLVFGVVRDLRVEVDAGRVYLYGIVPREADREEAERLVRSLSGVRDVVNMMDAEEP